MSDINKKNYLNGKRYALYGIAGVYNFGCEAIVRGTTSFIKAIDNNANINYYTFNYQYDEERLKDLDINIIPIKRGFFPRAYNKIIIKTNNINNQILSVKCKEMIKNNDYIVSIGGDIYTIPESYRKQKKYPFFNELIEVGKKALKMGRKVVVYGASIGPFGNYDRANYYYFSQLKKYSVIVCREYESLKYLQENNLNNAVFMPDPAFIVSGETKKYDKERPYIGLNFSPLSFGEIYGFNQKVNYTLLANIIKEIQEETGKKILLIPHVVAKYESDNDLIFMRHIADLTDCEIANVKDGFLGIKEQLQDCCLIASARMHCCINAIVENIPTIFISYSRKSIGMCEYVYGNKKWVVNLKEIDEKLLPKIKEMYVNRDAINKQLINRNSEIVDYYKAHISEIKKKIEDVN